VIVAPSLRDWASATALVSRKQYQHGEQVHDLSVTPLAKARYRVSDAERSAVIELFSMADNTAHVGIDDAQHMVRYLLPEAGKLYLSIDGRSAQYCDRIRLDGVQDQTGGSGRIVAPMHGLLLEVRVTAGDTVEAGQTLAILEAMKMHYEIVADIAGEVVEVLATAGTQVAADDLLIDIGIAE
jgi:geranyl-CoA carboxylase alpha subunit